MHIGKLVSFASGKCSTATFNRADLYELYIDDGWIMTSDLPNLCQFDRKSGPG